MQKERPQIYKHRRLQQVNTIPESPTNFSYRTREGIVVTATTEDDGYDINNKTVPHRGEFTTEAKIGAFKLFDMQQPIPYIEHTEYLQGVPRRHYVATSRGKGTMIECGIIDPEVNMSFLCARLLLSPAGNLHYAEVMDEEHPAQVCRNIQNGEYMVLRDNPRRGKEVVFSFDPQSAQQESSTARSIQFDPQQKSIYFLTENEAGPAEGSFPLSYELSDVQELLRILHHPRPWEIPARCSPLMRMGIYLDVDRDNG